MSEPGTHSSKTSGVTHEARSARREGGTRLRLQEEARVSV